MQSLLGHAVLNYERPDVFVRLDSVLTDEKKHRLTDRCLLKTIRYSPQDIDRDTDIQPVPRTISREHARIRVARRREANAVAE